MVECVYLFMGQMINPRGWVKKYKVRGQKYLYPAGFKEAKTILCLTPSMKISE